MHKDSWWDCIGLAAIIIGTAFAVLLFCGKVKADELPTGNEGCSFEEAITIHGHLFHWQLERMKAVDAGADAAEIAEIDRQIERVRAIGAECAARYEAVEALKHVK